MLTETQSPALFSRQLSGYTVFTIPATSLGKAGEGVLLAVRQQLPFSISHSQADHASSTIWLTLKPSQSQQPPLILAVCYIPPDSHHSAQPGRRSAQVRFESLAAQIAQFSSEGHVLLAGDLNARIGAASQPWVAELGADISIQLQNSDATVNGHGRKLLRLCGEAAMVLCTGRTTGDTPAQPSYRARSNTEPSRCLHSLSLSLSPGPCIGWLWPFSCSPDLQGWYSPAGVRPLPLGAAAASHSSCASGKPASTSGFHPHLGVGWRPAGSLCGCPHVRAMPDPYR